MSDAWHQFGSDLAVSATGDLLLASGPDQVQQRVLRRLLTNPLAYIWQPTYGAGLGRFVGQPANPARIRGVVRRQMRLEADVAQDPAPTADVVSQNDGTVVLTVGYVDAPTGTTQSVSGTVGV